jgi:hypothetical protein
MNKIEMFLNNFNFSQPKTLYFASSYIDAMRLLYQNGQDEIWVSKGEEFAKGIINRYQDKSQGAAEELGSVYEPYAICQDLTKVKTKIT